VVTLQLDSHSSYRVIFMFALIRQSDTGPSSVRSAACVSCIACGGKGLKTMFLIVRIVMLLYALIVGGTFTGDRAGSDGK